MLWLLEEFTIVVVDINGVFKSPLVSLLTLKRFSANFESHFCFCKTACLNVSSNGFDIRVKIPDEDRLNILELEGSPVDLVDTIAAVVVTGTVIVVVSPGGPVNEDIAPIFRKSWNKPVSSQCLKNGDNFGVNNCCCWLNSTVVAVVVIGKEVVTVDNIGVTSGKVNCCCCCCGDDRNKGGSDGVKSEAIVTGESEPDGAKISKTH